MGMYANLLAKSLANFRNNNKALAALSGRPHGLGGAVADLFGDRLVTILPLNIGQVEAYVRKWFCAVMEQDQSACLKTADEMLEEMQGASGGGRVKGHAAHAHRHLHAVTMTIRENCRTSGPSCTTDSSMFSFPGGLPAKTKKYCVF